MAACDYHRFLGEIGCAQCERERLTVLLTEERSLRAQDNERLAQRIRELESRSKATMTLVSIDELRELRAFRQRHEQEPGA